MIGAEQLERAAALTAARTPFVTATVVRARRPASVHVGDGALVLADGTIEGFVGGACAVESVRLHALHALETGEPLLLRIVAAAGEQAARGPEDELATGGAPDAAVAVERNPCLSGGSLEIFLEPRLPPPRVLILGATPIARALVAVARAAGFDALAAGPDDPLPGDAVGVVLASHGAGEEKPLEAALQAGVPYVALVASRRRGEAVRGSLALPAVLRSRLRTPAGLDLGARTPGEVAVSILAELIAELRSGATSATGAPERPAEAEAPDPGRRATDPVCGMSVAACGQTPHLDTPTGRVYFCCAGCRDAYAQQHAV